MREGSPSKPAAGQARHPVLATVAIQSPWSRSGGETIVVMKSFEHGPGLDHGAERERRRPRRGVERGWRRWLMPWCGRAVLK